MGSHRILAHQRRELLIRQVNYLLHPEETLPPGVFFNESQVRQKAEEGEEGKREHVGRRLCSTTRGGTHKQLRRRRERESLAGEVGSSLQSLGSIRYPVQSNAE